MSANCRSTVISGKRMSVLSLSLTEKAISELALVRLRVRTCKTTSYGNMQVFTSSRDS